MLRNGYVTVCGLTSGSVSIAGVDVSRDTRRARRHIGLAPQELGIYPILTSRENLVFFGELNGLFGRRLKQRVNEVAEALELTPILQQRAFELSGGQKRRLHTACALLHRPPLVMLDEPTVGADVGTRLALLHAVRRLADEGSGVIYSTHYLPEIEELRASVAILQGGRIIARGTLDDLVAEHGTSVIELTFEGPPPAIAVDLPTEVHDSTVRIVTDTPATAAATALAALGEEDEKRLRGVQILRPSLESVYLSLTGERYSSSGSAPAAALSSQ